MASDSYITREGVSARSRDRLFQILELVLARKDSSRSFTYTFVGFRAVGKGTRRFCLLVVSSNFFLITATLAKP